MFLRSDRSSVFRLPYQYLTMEQPTHQSDDPVSISAEPAPRRIPNFGHALLFVSAAALLLLLIQLFLLILGESPTALRAGAISVQHPKLQIAALGATYLCTLLAAWLFYPLVWRRSFLEGISWHWSTARAQAPKLISLGLLLGAMMQVVTYFITPPKILPIDEFFATPTDAWLITLFGTIVAPVFEEICFRGFLVPAFAIAYDWLTLSRTDQARTHWRTTTTLTPPALMFSAVLTSILFAMLHAQQVAHLWAALLVLFSVSLVLTVVRVQTQSVAASALVHAAYNGFVFLTVLIATGGYRHLDRMTR
jgi:membrane protease YdiL (CAAX protease family)